jgi:hypothetical protein
MSTVTLQPLASADREQFIKDNHEAFNYGALEEFGLRDEHFEEDGQIISRDTIEQSIDSGEACRILSDGDIVDGAVIKVDGKHGDLELLFIKPNVHSRGIGYLKSFHLTLYNRSEDGKCSRKNKKIFSASSTHNKDPRITVLQ